MMHYAHARAIQAKHSRGGDVWHTLIGTPLYFSGTSGTVTIPSGACVFQVSVQSTTGGSFTLFGGVSIPVPVGAAGYPFEFFFEHTLYESNSSNLGQIVFTGTTHYFVHAVRQGNV